MKISNLLKVSAIAYVIALLTYLNSFIATQNEFHSNTLTSIALLTMYFNLGQSVLCYGYNGYIVYLKKNNNVTKNFKSLLNKVKFGLVVNIISLVSIIFLWSNYCFKDGISYLFFSFLGMVSGFIACGLYALEKNNLAIVIEKCNVISISLSLLFVIFGWQENIISMSTIIVFIFVIIASLKLKHDLVHSIVKVEKTQSQTQSYGSKFFFYNSVNALCSYLFLFLDQWLISTTTEDIANLGVYFLAIQIINFLKYTQTQTSKLLLASIEYVNNAYFNKVSLVYISITTLVILVVLPFKYVDLDLNNKFYFAYDNIDLIIYFVTMTTLGVVYNQFLIFLGDVKELTKCNFYIFSLYLITLIIYINFNDTIELRDLLIIKCFSGFIGQLILLKRIIFISRVKGGAYYYLYFLNTILLVFCFLMDKSVYVEILLVVMFIFVINLKKKKYVEYSRSAD
ncbi:membrane protein, putative [Aliivibrio fischeri MJ11]|uniref:Membrane protein, putative n=1 Tax=Aliivibrio fischeri (strain MJ11) TaxID=388396 RepID=B5FFU6_ALIFM|nr:hypothetical protein [Aliivibrio fischeri]ACH65034.1 membrane protein, putative [Aliivibrio fischeri MJ11]